MLKLTRQLFTATLILCSIFLSSRAQAQELQCIVNVSAPTLGSDQQVYGQLQEAITKYINFREWSEMKYEPQERIKCRMQLIINARPSVDRFEGTMQVQLIRPTFNSTYESVVINLQDKDVRFNFVPFQPLEWSENAYIDNLTSILNFYAYMLIGFDQETFQMNSGAEHFQKAQAVVNLASNSGEPGWRNFDGTRNRYWLVTDMMDNTLKQIHNIFYVYHRQGLDQMEKNLQLGRAAIIGALKELQKLNQRYPAKYITRVFITAKSPEIVDMFKKADMRDKRQLIAIMDQLDPANASEYQSILQEK